MASQNGIFPPDRAQESVFLSVLRKLYNSPVGGGIVLVGGLAVRFYGYARYTEDVDLCLAAQSEDYKTLEQSLSGLGRILFLSQDRSFCRLLIDGVRTEIIIVPEGARKESVLFANVFKRAREFTLAEELKIKVVAPEELISLKLLAGRHRDVLDVSWLLENVRIDYEILGQELREIACWKPSICELLGRHFPGMKQLLRGKNSFLGANQETDRKKREALDPDGSPRGEPPFGPLPS